MQINIKADFDDLTKDLKKLQKQIPFATALGLTKTAQVCAKSFNRSLAKAIDRPTPRTQKATRFERAKKTNLVARVYIQDSGVKGVSPADYLTVLDGGPRNKKRSEGALRASGKIADFQYITPASQKLNKYGNVTGAAMNKILSRLKSQRDALQNSKSGNLFVVNQTLGLGKRGRTGLSDGIYRRKKKGVTKLFHIVNRKPTVKKLIDFHKTVKAKAEAVSPQIFNNAMQRALRTMR